MLTKGKNHPKAKKDGGISITKNLWNTFVDNRCPDKYQGVVIGKTIFWGTNKTEPKNKDYQWKYLLNSKWFIL